MRASIPFVAILSLLAISGYPAGTASSGESPSPPAQDSDAPPALITPGRPHAPSYDPHVRLDPETQIRIALRHEREGRHQEALNTLSLAIDANPESARLHAVRGSMLLAEQQVVAALRDLEKAVQLDPDSAEALTNRAQAYRLFGRLDEALGDLDRALAKDPDLVAARFNRGALRFGKQDYQGALADFDHCVAVDPHAPGPYYNRAAVNDALGRRDLAIADMERFIEISDNPQWREQAGKLLAIWRNPDVSADRAGEPAPQDPSPHRR